MLDLLFLYTPFTGLRKCLLAFFLLQICLLSEGQQAVSISFFKDSVLTVRGESFSNALIVTNHSEESIILKRASPDSFALLSLPDTIFLDRGEKKKIPVKYLASTSLARLFRGKIHVSYQIAGTLTSVAASFSVNSQSGQQLLLTIVDPVNYLNTQTNQGKVQVKCISNAYTDQSFLVKLKSYPEGLEIVDNDRMIRLQPGGQQLLTFSFRNRLSQNLTSDFSLSVSATDLSSGKELAATNTKVLVLANEKRLPIANTPDALLMNNDVQLGYWNTNNGLSYYQLGGRGMATPSLSSTLRYSLNFNYYTKPRSGAEMYDSWVAYKNKHFGVQLGNVSENLDYSLFGKGVKLSVFPDSANSMSGYYIKNDYLIFSDVNRRREAASVWAGQYTHTGKSNTSSVKYLAGKDPYTGVQMDLVSTQSGWQLKGDQVLELEAGYSREALSANKAVFKNGYAGGIRYKYSVNKWSIISDNYYSTPYYSGLRRGALLLQEHADHRLDSRRHIFAHYEVVHNTPDYLNAYYAALSYTKTAQYQIGFSSATDRWFMSLRPYYYTQALKQKILGMDLALRSTSWHLAADVSYNAKGHVFMFSGDYGNVNSSNPYLARKNYMVWQGRFSYNYSMLGFNAFIQYNPYYLIQEPLPWQREEFRQYSFSPYVRFYALDKRLEIEASDNLNYYGYYLNGWSNMVQGRASFSFKRTWQASAQILYNTYQQYPDNNFLQANVSITKFFMQRNAPGHKSLSVVFYGDENANGVWDNDEQPVENVIAAVGQALAQSDHRGKVSFTNLEPSTHTLRIQKGNGWWLMTPLDVSLSRNRTLKVALVKTASVSGKVIGHQSEYVQDVPVLEGIRIVATGPRGERFIAVTDESGGFSFNLPTAVFSFSAELQNGSQSISNQPQSLKVSMQNNPPIIFNLVDRSRSVDIKQF